MEIYGDRNYIYFNSDKKRIERCIREKYKKGDK